LFVLGTLSFNLSKNEASFHMHRSETSPVEQKNLNQGVVTDHVDHITWHEKTMHIRTKTIKLQTIPYSSLFPRQKTIVPLYVEGFFLNQETVMLRSDATFKNWENSNEVLIFETALIKNFSLIFLLVPEDWTTSDIILKSGIRLKNGSEIPLFYLRTVTHEIGRIKPFLGWDILIFTTPYTRELSSTLPNLGNSYRQPDFVSPVDSITSILEQAKARPLLDEETILALYQASSR
jgi:hypothetical protein